MHIPSWQDIVMGMGGIMGDNNWAQTLGSWVMAALVFITPTAGLNVYFTRAEIDKAILTQEKNRAAYTAELVDNMSALTLHVQKIQSNVQLINSLLEKDMDNLRKRLDNLEAAQRRHEL